ncbi:transglycosylase domain-containing protein [Glycomyces sp. NRRL B-16210]|uniref:transglycosylase domain-containing protein n=1 Tax=Glycomyces sp. NRRL B-16210 TaxID=1463821 RepID=UPI0004BFFCF9|nr:transglycosylase domain-containing protein [Glycomyces sp. NRRL B-16210]
MSDYGYRPAPPPEDGRDHGRGAGRQGGRAYGNAPADGGRSGSGDPDYGWGGGRQQGGPAPRSRSGQYGTPASGSASVGRASGSASVGRASGSASVGSASVGGPGRPGRASVGSASVGSASVGSASVGSASVTAPAPARTRPGTSGPGDAGERGGRRRAGKGPLKDPETGKKKKRRFGRKMLAVVIALGILFIAAVTIVGSYFFVDVEQPGNLARAGESSSFTYADGDTEVGGYGESLRLQADPDEIPDTVKKALVATEDRKFYDHGGVDVTRTLGAFVNNLGGGDTQGASTITQQYAGMVMAIRDEISYDRKAREAAMAIKIESKFEKDEIITAYLNLAYFGRGATGIEAAAKVYFDKELLDLDYDEAAYIVMQVKSPNGLYDPYYGEGNGDMYSEEATVDRWNYSMRSMVETGALTQAERDAYEMPVPIDSFNSAGSWGGNTDLGFIVNELDGYVFDELEARYGITADMLGGKNGENGGYKVVLTIDEDIQDSLVSTGSRGDVKLKQDDEGNYLDKEGNPVDSANEAAIDETSEGYAQFVNDNPDAALVDYKAYMMTAMVAIDPETGAVLGYYGGDDGFGVDKAGAESPHPPSSTMKLVTAATAIENGDSIESWFNAGSPREFDSLVLEESESCIGGGTYPKCTLRNGDQTQTSLEMQLSDAVVNSKNTPMYSIAEQYGADAILRYATAMGLSTMNQPLQVRDDEGEFHSPQVNYEFIQDEAGEYRYILHGFAVDAEGNNVTNVSGNLDDWALVEVDENCNPKIRTDGMFVEDTDGVPTSCPIGGTNHDKKTDPFYYHLSFGQYPTSVKDMAAIYATIANDGYFHETHYVEKVYDYRGEEVPELNPLAEGQVIATETARDLQWVGSQIKGESKVGEDLTRDFFGKTGTWEAAGKDENGQDYPSGWNAHAWYVGAIPQLSIAAWVGNLSSESDPIAGPDGSNNNVFGGNTAYPVWLTAMDRILSAKGDNDHWKPVDWEGPVKKGSATTWDLEKFGGPSDGGAFCAANPEDALCEGQALQQAQEECEAGGGTWDGQACQQEQEEDDNDWDPPTTDPTTDPGEGESGEECDTWPFNCPDDPTTDPGDGTEPTEEESTRGWGG